MAPLAMALIFSGSVFLGRKLTLDERAVFTPTSQDLAESASFRWNPALFRLLAFGHVPSAVDWLLLRFITDNNMTKVTDEIETEAYRVLNLATDLDPAFFSLYSAGANYLSIVRNDRKGAIALVEKGRDFLRGGLQEYPARFRDTEWGAAWVLPFIRGYLYLFEYQDVGRGAEAYAEAADYPNAPAGVRNLAAHAATVDGQYNLGINSISILRNFAKEDPATLRSLDEKEKLLLTARNLHHLNLKFAGYRKGDPAELRWQRFRVEERIPERDPLGGRIVLRPDGRIDSETPKKPVLGIDLEKLMRSETNRELEMKYVPKNGKK